MSARRIVAGVVAIGLGVAALATAHDIHAWQSAFDHGDAQFATQPATARWQAASLVPGDPAFRLLALDDDRAVRSGEKAFTVALVAPKGFDEGREQSRLRGLAALALSDAVADGSPAQASRAGNLLGILAATDESGSDASVNDRRAAETFEAAIRADPENESAKYNLELILRRIKVVGSREGAGGSSGDFGQSLTGAGAGLPGSGY